MVKEIKQKDFKKLNILVLQTKKILNIFKTMIFVDKIKGKVKIVQYL